MRFYTGIGSRQTPDNVLRLMYAIAVKMSLAGYVLRSGGADGADSAFESGVMNGSPHIYLPWPAFNGRTDRVGRTRPRPEAYALAKTVHPKWDSLPSGARALHARNCHQVLGDDLKTPSDFLVCWTPDGCQSEATRTRETGGTATAIVLACRFEIPVFNLRNDGALDALRQFLMEKV